MPKRPLSPHVTVYKWAYTMTLSILHRVSGIALFAALVVRSSGSRPLPRAPTATPPPWAYSPRCLSSA